MNCDICGSKKVTFQDEFQKLCTPCHDNEIAKEERYFDDVMIHCRSLYLDHIK